MCIRDRSPGFCLIPEVRVEYLPDAGSARARLPGFLTGARGEDAAARGAYLEGRLFQIGARPADALERFEKAGAGSSREPLPLLRLVECLEALGKGAEACERLRAVPSLDRLNRELLERWVAAEKAAGRDPEKSPASWPRRAPPWKGGSTAP